MDEPFKNNTYRVLELFIEFPNREFSLRGIARELRLSHATVIKCMNTLQKYSLFKKKTGAIYPTYYADTESRKYRFYKRNRLVFMIMDSELVDYIQKETLPSLIILFGSGAKATLTEKSDIDIFVETKEKQLDLAKYEKKLRHKVNLLFEPSINNLSKELRNNIINGIVLYGFIKIKED